MTNLHSSEIQECQKEIRRLRQAVRQLDEISRELYTNLKRDSAHFNSPHVNYALNLYEKYFDLELTNQDN